MKNFLFVFLPLFICIGCFAVPEVKSVSLEKPEKTLNVKNYQQMTDEEKNKFIADESKKFLGKIGQPDGGQLNEKSVASIRKYVDAYAKRNTETKTTNTCAFGNDLTTLLTRGKTYSQIISDEFAKTESAAQIGIYLAMTESEFCPCIQSPAGPLGMFQFTQTNGKTYGLNAQKGATPQNPDDRCDPQLSSRAAAKYVQKLVTEDFGGSQKSTAYILAIGAFNSSESGLSQNLKTSLEAKTPLPNDIWALISDSENFSKQFQAENFRYIPKFFAAAIVGENPQTFGVNLAPLSESK